MKGYVRLEIDPDRIPPRKIARAVEVIAGGGIAAYPTDTRYALGCALTARKAAEEICRARDIAETHRMALICPDLSTAAQFAQFSHDAYRVLRRILPGPYTIIVQATREVPRALLKRQRREVGLRIVDHPIVHAIVTALGQPLVTTTAVPPGGEIACSDADEILECFARTVDLVIDGGPTPDEASTIIKFHEDGAEVVRHGLGSVDDLITR